MGNCCLLCSFGWVGPNIPGSFKSSLFTNDHSVIIAAAAVPHLGWRFTVWEVLIASAPAAVMLMFLPETSSPTILYYRAKRLRRATGNLRIRAESEISQAGLTVRDVIVEALLIPCKITILDPAMLFVNIYFMLIYGIFTRSSRYFH
jgi:MFS transporter, DHA1 family, multidrug resistance protein